MNTVNWEQLTLDRPTWRRTVKTGAAIYAASGIAAPKAKREARKSQQRPVRNAAAQSLPTCLRCQRTFRARIGLVEHLRINCASRTAPNIVPTPAPSSSTPSSTNSDNSSEPPLPSSSSTTTAPATAVQAAVSHITIPGTTTNATPTTSDCSDWDQDYTCPHCDRTFTSHIGLVGHLQIHRTETGAPVSGAPTYTHRTRLHCPRTFTHRMGLFGHMRIHKSGIDRNTGPSMMPNPTPTSSPCVPTALPATDTDTIGLVGHLRIHRRLANQCLEHQPIPTTLNSAARTVLAPSGFAWAYSATCASTTTCGRQPLATPHTPYLLHHHHPTTHQHSPTASTQLLPPTQVGSVHLDSVPMRLRLHGRLKSETIPTRQVLWIGRLLIDACSRFTQFVPLCMCCVEWRTGRRAETAPSTAFSRK
nr:unnamed protein product [Spirometra erinaceieuropaei]